MSPMEKTIPAIHERDLPDMLQRYGVKDAVENGQYRCTECSRTLSPGTLGSIRRSNGKLVFTCKNVLCYYKAVNKTRNRYMS